MQANMELDPIADEFMNELVRQVRYWQSVAEEKNLSADEALEALGFSICTMIDGCSDNSYDVYLRDWTDGTEKPALVEQVILHDYYYQMLLEVPQV